MSPGGETPNPENALFRPDQRQNAEQLLAKPMFENEQAMGRFLENLLNRVRSLLDGTESLGFSPSALMRTRRQLSNPNIPIAQNDFQQRLDFARAQAAVRARAGVATDVPLGSPVATPRPAAPAVETRPVTPAPAARPETRPPAPRSETPAPPTRPAPDRPPVIDRSALDAYNARLNAITLDPAFTKTIDDMVAYETSHGGTDAVKATVRGLADEARNTELQTDYASENPTPERIDDTNRAALREWKGLDDAIKKYQPLGVDVSALIARRERAYNVGEAWKRFADWVRTPRGPNGQDNLRREATALDALLDAPNLVAVFKESAQRMIAIRKGPQGFYREWAEQFGWTWREGYGWTNPDGRMTYGVPPVPLRNAELPRNGYFIVNPQNAQRPTEAEDATNKRENSEAIARGQAVRNDIPVPEKDTLRYVYVYKEEGGVRKEYRFEFVNGGPRTLDGPEGIRVEAPDNTYSETPRTAAITFTKPGDFSFYADYTTASNAPLRAVRGPEVSPAPGSGPVSA